MIDVSFPVTNQLQDRRYCNGCYCINRTPSGFYCNVFGDNLTNTDDDKVVRSTQCKGRFANNEDEQREGRES